MHVGISMDNKIKIAENFLRSLEDPDSTVALMNERMDTKLLYVIHNYAGLINKTKKRLSLNDKDIIASAMIIGYLLKGHMDRYDIEKAFNNLNFDLDSDTD